MWVGYICGGNQTDEEKKKILKLLNRTSLNSADFYIQQNMTKRVFHGWEGFQIIEKKVHSSTT